jgi:hypothetical protein
MIAGRSFAQDVPARRCLCCGEAVETPSIPACWDHWVLLPADLQSSIIKASGRGRLADYGAHILKAIKIWRRAGIWRAKGGTSVMSGCHQPSNTTILETRTVAEFLRLADRRRKNTMRQVRTVKRQLRLVLAFSESIARHPQN